MASNETYQFEVKRIEVKSGEDVRQKVDAFIRESGWKSVYISGAIGSVRDVQFVVPVGNEWPPKKLEVTTCSGPAEVLSFTGELMAANEVPPPLKAVYTAAGEKIEDYFIHIHASVAIAGAHVYGGGLMSAKALRAVNIFIQQGK